LKKHSPDYFILENVKRLLEMDNGQNFATILVALSELDYLIEWRLVNTMYFGLPQNRPRIVITGKLRKSNGIAGKQSILLSSEEVKQIANKNMSLFDDEKRWINITDHGKSFPTWGIAFNGKFFGHTFKNFTEAMPPVLLESVMEKEVNKEFVYTEDTLKRIENSVLVDRLINGIHVMYNQKGGARMGYTIFATKGVAPTLTCTTSRHYERYQIGDIYRRLTNVEYARIQGFPDDHCSAVSVYKQYKLFGNAIAPPMVSWALKKLFIDKPVTIEE
jgi:DNA (cytosine-5)-methyltransferase 1